MHWSDTATIEWLAYMARRRGPARLLVLGTYRPVEAIVRAHPVRAMVQELTLHGYGAELALGEWSEVGVAAYLAQRGAGAAGPAALARVLTQRTEGHPLFVVAAWWTSCCGRGWCGWRPRAGSSRGDSTP